jgi:hypothetical protein
MTELDHCPACSVARQLTEHRNTTAPDWTERRATLNYARIIATRTCPNYTPTTTEETA